MFLFLGSGDFDKALLALLLLSEKQKIFDWMERPLSLCHLASLEGENLLQCRFFNRTLKGIPAWLFLVTGCG